MYRRIFFSLAWVGPATLALFAAHWPGLWWAFVVVGPLVAVGLYDVLQRRHSLLRVYPVLGHGRYLMEAFRPELQQYFVESNVDGMPLPREFRSVVYQRSKGEVDTLPFGTQRDVNRVGYEFMNHSLCPKERPEIPPRVHVGGPGCTRPYDASYLNVSAMSYGALSKNAVLALNAAAKQGGFAHNTGEGGISAYHLESGADLIWQIGTGYFGCRDRRGGFDAGRFADGAARDAVKMIEIKLSQGAKPAHGGILPAAKVTAEIAGIRGVPPGREVVSPRSHREFDSPRGLLEFVARLRARAGGKPVGFKLCLGYRSDFLGICKAMLATGILPDFITIDGAEGGTGAAPIELANSVGMPLNLGLSFAHNALRGIGVRDRIRVLAAGKIVTGFHLFRTLALGADLCASARPMMLALGCVQARRCNDNSCPVGVATQDPARFVGLVVPEKAQRVARYHAATVASLLDLVAAAGLESPAAIRPRHVLRRTAPLGIRSFAELYPWLDEGALLARSDRPPGWQAPWEEATPDRF